MPLQIGCTILHTHQYADTEYMTIPLATHPYQPLVLPDFYSSHFKR